MKAPRVLALACAALLAIRVEANQAQAPLPADLAAVPADALGFVHIRAADLWKSDALKELRDTVQKAGEKALVGFDKRFLPTPSSVERLTFVLIAQDADLEREPLWFGILSVNKPFDKDALLKSALPGGVEKSAKNGAYFVDATSKMAVALIDNQVIAFGPVKAIQAYRERAAKADGPLADSLQLANTNRHLTLAGNLTAIPEKMRNEIPPPFWPLLQAKTVSIGVDLGDTSVIDVRLLFPDNQKAEAGETAIKEVAELVRSFLNESRKKMLAKVLADGQVAPLEQFPEAAMALLALGGVERVDEILSHPPIKRDGSTLQASMKLPVGLGTISLGIVGASAAGVYFIQNVEDAKKEKARLDIKILDLAAQTYVIKNEKPPENLSQLFPLIENAGPSTLVDPWGKKYQYRYDAATDRILIETTAPDGTIINNDRPKR